MEKSPKKSNVLFLDNNKNADQRTIKMHFNQQKRIREKLQGKTITTYYSREPEGTAAVKHPYPAMLPAREIINHSNAQTMNSIGRVQTLAFPHCHKASNPQIKK